jgi:acyl carrier protein
MLADASHDQDVQSVIHDYLETRFPALQPISADTELLTNGAIDSLGFLELLMFLGERFGIELGDDDFDPENLQTPAHLVRFVSRGKT